MREHKQGIYEFHNFQLDIGKGILLRENQPVTLQLKTFDLLCALVGSNGNLVTRDELMNALWADTFVEDNNLSQHIRLLRKALGDGANGAVFIETVPRRGYRFLPDVRAVNFAGQANAAILSSNLSASPAMLIGREKEIAGILNLLRREDVRILTLTGVGGTGKTTLARAVALEIISDFKNGVFFVELAAVTKPELVASTIAQPLGLKETAGKPILEMLKDYLREKRMLIVADNFEQILTAAPVLTELIKAALDLKILVTSRARLQLRETHEFTVPPLAVPESSSQVSLDELAENESVRLFTERARAANPNFSLSKENAGSVAEICRRLDGLPLAIELAAARARIIPPKSILEKLENRLKLLTGGARDLPARQQTVHGTVEWSYELLDDNEKRLFRRLAVFAGSFTFEAAEAVCGNYESNEDRIKVLDAVTSLLDKSLLVQKEQADGEPRFRMLEVVREYGLETLEESGEAENMRRRHAAYFLALGKKAEPHLQRAESIKWLNRLEEEHDNIRAVLTWALENDLKTAAQLATSIVMFWILHSHLVEGRQWVKAALEKEGCDVSSTVRFKLLMGIGVMTKLQGDYKVAQKMFEEGLATGKATNDLRQIAWSSRHLGTIAHGAHNFRKAREFIEESLMINRRLNDKSGIAHTLCALGNLTRTEGDSVMTRQHYEEALTLFLELENHGMIITLESDLGVIAYEKGDYNKAHSLFAKALLMAQKLGYKTMISFSLDGFAALAAKQEDSSRAAQLAGAAKQLRELVNYQMDSIDRSFCEQYISKLRAGLSQAEFELFYEQGRKLKLEEAVKLALETHTNTDSPDPLEIPYPSNVPEAFAN